MPRRTKDVTLPRGYDQLRAELPGAVVTITTGQGPDGDELRVGVQADGDRYSGEPVYWTQPPNQYNPRGACVSVKRYPTGTPPPLPLPEVPTLPLPEVPTLPPPNRPIEWSTANHGAVITHVPEDPNSSLPYLVIVQAWKGPRNAEQDQPTAVALAQRFADVITQQPAETPSTVPIDRDKLRQVWELLTSIRDDFPDSLAGNMAQEARELLPNFDA